MIVMKSWIRNDFDTSEDRKQNKIIVKESVLFCNKCWGDRCKVLQHEEKQKKRLSQCCVNFLNETLNGESKARRCHERTKLDIDRSPNETIVCWILRELKIRMKLKKIHRMTLEGFPMDKMNSA